MSAVKPTTRQSSDAPASAGRSAGSISSSARSPHQPMTRPSTPAASGEHEALDQQLAEDLPALGAERVADGNLALPRRRATSSRLATLAQAISSTKPTAVSSTMQRGAHAADELLAQRQHPHRPAGVRRRETPARCPRR